MADALLHRDGAPPAQHRRALADALLSDVAAARVLHDRLKCPDPALVALLREKGLLMTPSFAVGNALKVYFPSQSIDLSPKAIDAWLLREKAESWDALSLSPPS